MLLRSVGSLLVVQQYMNNTSYRFFMLIGKVEIVRFFNLEFLLFVIFIVLRIDLLPFRALIWLVFKLSTPITVVNPRLGVEILFVLCSCGCCCCWCWCRVVGRLTSWLSQPLWNSAELSRHLLTFQLVLNAWKVEPCFVVSRFSILYYELH